MTASFAKEDVIQNSQQLLKDINLSFNYENVEFFFKFCFNSQWWLFFYTHIQYVQSVKNTEDVAIGFLMAAVPDFSL